MPAGVSDVPVDPNGLTHAEAVRWLDADGRNIVANVAPHPLREVVGKFWAPVPWLLEAAIVLQLFLHDHLEAVARAAPESKTFVPRSALHAAVH